MNEDSIMSKHTEGPWEINGVNEDNGRTRIGSAKDYICEMCHNPDDEASVEENEQQTEANVNLIASAPELLEACKNALDIFEGEWPKDDEVMGEVMTNFKDLISKAGGNYE